MNFRGIKNTVLVLAVAGTFLAPSVKAEAAELSALVSAGVTTTMEQVEDVTPALTRSDNSAASAFTEGARNVPATAKTNTVFLIPLKFIIYSKT